MAVATFPETETTKLLAAGRVGLAPVVQTIYVSVAPETEQSIPSIVTLTSVLTVPKPVPVIVNYYPPAGDPYFGEIVLIIGVEADL